MKADQYHSSPGLSASLAKTLLAKSPYHAWMQSPLNPDRNPLEASRLDIGTAAHALLLEGRDVIAVCDYDDWRTKAAQAARDDARAIGRIPLLTHQAADVEAMYQAAIETSLQAGYDLAHGKPEQSFFWTDNGTAMRARLDWVSDDRTLIIDYKTTGLESPEAWMRAMTGAGMDVQAAHYINAVEQDEGSPRPEFVFMVQETDAPYLVYFVEPSAAMLEIGEQKMQIARKRWQACIDANEWPGYGHGVMIAEPPAWALADIEDKMITQETWNELAFRFGKVAPKERYTK